MKKEWGKLALTSALGIFLSSSFVFLAALPIRYLRIGYGRAPFIAVSLLATIVLLLTQQLQWGLVYFSISFLVGCYSELEEQKFSLFSSSTLSIGLTAFLSIFCFGLIARFEGATLFSYLEQQLGPLMTQLQQMPQLKDMSSMQSIIGYLPSGLIISLMVILFITLSVYSNADGTKNAKALKSFSLPEPLIWLFLAALAGTFLLEADSIGAVVAGNIFSILLAGYFFQGLAVTACYLDFYQVYGFWRMLIYFLIFFQMFLFVGGLGVLDFWFDFRGRLISKIKKLNSRREEKL